MNKTKFGVSYHGNRFLSHAREDLKKIAACSDYVVHTVSEDDLNFHKAALSRIFAETRRQGLEIWADPWGLGGVFGGEASSRFLTEHRDSWQVMSNGKIVPGACLNRPELRSFVKEWVLNVVDMGAQVIFWDEPHISFDFESEWQGVYSCTCDVCQKLFKSEFGSKMPAKMNDHARQFRRQTMGKFLRDMMAFAKAKKLRNALCLYAFKGHKEYDLIWKEASSLPELDIFGCDPYWRWHGKKDPKKHVSEFSKYVVDSARSNGKSSQVWIQGMRLPKGHEEEVKLAIEAAVHQGVEHIAVWSYDGGELLDTVLSENPKAVWEAVEASFKKFRT